MNIAGKVSAVKHFVRFRVGGLVLLVPTELFALSMSAWTNKGLEVFGRTLDDFPVSVEDVSVAHRRADIPGGASWLHQFGGLELFWMRRSIARATPSIVYSAASTVGSYPHSRSVPEVMGLMLASCAFAGDQGTRAGYQRTRAGYQRTGPYL